MRHFRFVPLLACGLGLSAPHARAQDPAVPAPQPVPAPAPEPAPVPAPAETPAPTPTPAPATPEVAPPAAVPAPVPVPAPAPETPAPPQVPPPTPEPAATPAPQPAPPAAQPEPAPQAPAAAPVPAPVPPPAPAPAPAPAPIRGILSARTVPVGGTAILSFRLIGVHVSQFHGRVEQIFVPGLQIEYRGTGPRMLRLREGVTNATEVNFAVQGVEPGDHLIPSQTFRVDDRVFTTEPMTVTVNDGPSVEAEYQPLAQLTVSKTEMWKGEVVPISVSVLVHPGVQPLSPFFPQIQGGGFAVTRFDRSAGINEEVVNGELWRAWMMQSVMTPLKSGQQTFGPAEVKADVAMPLAGSARDQFGGFPSTKKNLKLESNTVTVNVKELPMNGRPEGFSGAVGDFTLEVAASPVELAVGESVILETRIIGTGNFDALEAPPLENADGWKTYKAKVSEENRGWGTEPGAKSFTQILTAEKNLTSLAPVVLHFFDPATGRYVTRKSQPIALKITGELKPAAGLAGAADFTLAADASVPVEELNDILPQPLSAKRWIIASQPLTPLNPWLLNGAPAALAALILGAGAARRWRAAAARRAPKTDAPRQVREIQHDMVRHGLSRFAFYSLVSEFLHAWPVHSGKPLPPTAEMASLRAARDEWLYSRSAAESAEPMPAEEQRETRRILAQL